MEHECVRIEKFDSITTRELFFYDFVEIDGDKQEVRCFKKYDDLKNIIGEVII